MEELLDIAESEIETTTNDAVRSVVAEIGSELAYEKSLREAYQAESGRFERMAKEMEAELKKDDTTKKILWGVAIGEGVLLIGIVAGIFFMGSM